MVDIAGGGGSAGIEELSLTLLRRKWCSRDSVISEFLSYLVDYQGESMWGPVGLFKSRVLLEVIGSIERSIRFLIL